MQMTEKTTAKGALGITLTGPDGKVKETHELGNLVVNSGLAYLISRAVGTAKDTMSHMALGSGTADPAAGDTALGSELGRVSLDSTTISGGNDEQVIYQATFGPGDATGAVTEAGIFNAASGGDMLCRTEFPVVNKQSDDTMAITWTITLSAQ
jgi:hypothetical protein